MHLTNLKHHEATRPKVEREGSLKISLIEVLINGPVLYQIDEKALWESGLSQHSHPQGEFLIRSVCQTLLHLRITKATSNNPNTQAQSLTS